MTGLLALALQSCCPALAARRGPKLTTPIEAAHRVNRSPEVIHAFLADLSNHRHLTDRHLRLRQVASDGLGGHIVMSGPLGLRRTATTEVTSVEEPLRFGGTAAVGERTRARVDWTIEPDQDGARVTLRAVVTSTGPLDRALLAAGGRPWLRRRFERTLARLDTALEGADTQAST